MQPAEANFGDDKYFSDDERPDSQESDFSMGLDALNEWSYIRILHHDNPWGKATGTSVIERMHTRQTCMWILHHI
jgi:hypothetical protein